MRRWAPWLLAFIVWNGAFDLQVKRAARDFTDAQLERWRRQAAPVLIRDGFTPAVRSAALRATAVSLVVLAVGLARSRHRATPAPE